MVIQHLIAPAPFGGAERVVHALATGHRRRGHDVSVIVVVHGSEQGALADELRADGVPVFPIRVSPHAYGRERRRLASMLAAFEPDVLHTHGYRVDVLDAPVARRAGIPVVSTVHGFTGGDLKNRVYQWIQRRALGFFDAVVAVSRPLADDLRASGVPARCVHTVPNGRPPSVRPLGREAARRMLELPEDAFVVGWVGRLSPEKGPDVFVEAVGHPEMQTCPVVACVIGDGPMRARLEARARELGLEKTIHWKGAIPGAARLFPAFDVLAMSSRTEGTPVVALEAIDAGVPVVATSVGGVPDALAGTPGRLVQSEAPDALARALVEAAGGRLSTCPAVEGATACADGENWLDAYEAIYAHVSGEVAGEQAHEPVRRPGGTKHDS